MEAKARNTSLLKQKIDFLAEITNQFNKSKKRIKVKKKLTFISEEKNFETSKSLTTKALMPSQKNVNIQTDGVKFWKSTKKPYFFPKTIKRNGWKESDEIPSINWNHINSQSERIATTELKRRIDKFKSSTFIIESTLHKMMASQHSLITSGLRQFNITKDY